MKKMMRFFRSTYLLSRWRAFYLRFCWQPTIRAPRIQVQKYTIDATINPRTQSIEATAKIDFTPLESANQATFELNNALTVSKAVDDKGAAVATQRNASDFTIGAVFPGGLGEEPAGVHLDCYDGKLTGNEDSPISGITFAALHPDYGYLLYPARWFPVSGYSTNRFMAELHITTPAEYRVMGSGDEKSDQRQRRRHSSIRFHYDKASFPGSIGIVQRRSRAGEFGRHQLRSSYFRGDKAQLRAGLRRGNR